MISSIFRSYQLSEFNAKMNVTYERSYRYGYTPIGSAGPSLQLGTDTVAASDHVRVLGVTILLVFERSREK